MALLNYFNFTEHVNFPTHDIGHVLDFVCTTGMAPANLSGLDIPISDHKAILFSVPAPMPKPTNKHTITYRNMKRINTADPNGYVATT